MARLRANLAYGTVTDSPLLVGATTLNSAELPRLGTVVGSPNVLAVTLDPQRLNGQPEIVHVTTYDGSATSATILRAQEGTTAREHPAGTEWVHGGTARDFPGAMWVMSKSTSQTLGNNTVDTVTFDTTNEDSGESVIDLANNRFVIPTKGLYFALAHWLWEGTAPTNAGYTTTRINGSDTVPLVSVQGTPVAFQRLNGTFPFSAVAGDFVTMVINPGAVTGCSARGNASPHLRTTVSLIRVANL